MNNNNTIAKIQKVTVSGLEMFEYVVLQYREIEVQLEEAGLIIEPSAGWKVLGEGKRWSIEAARAVVQNLANSNVYSLIIR
jgi:hypothetical protein